MISTIARLVFAMVIFAVALPLEAAITVHFASVFNAAGKKINGVWLVGVDCGDGIVRGAGLCGDTPAECVSTAVAAQCSVAPPRPGGPPPGVDDLEPDVILNSRFPIDPAIPHVEPLPAWMAELAARSASQTWTQRTAAVAKLTDELEHVLNDCSVLCYWWGPGCPCWPGDDDWLGSHHSLLPAVAGTAADILVDMIGCGLRSEEEAARTGASPGAGSSADLVECALDEHDRDRDRTEEWTAWLDRDNPSGVGDYETLADHVRSAGVCPSPTAIECQTLDGRDWRNTGQAYVCSTTEGGICMNQNQRCLDYRVRFRCSRSTTP